MYGVKHPRSYEIQTSGALTKPYEPILNYVSTPFHKAGFSSPNSASSFLNATISAIDQNRSTAALYIFN